MDDTILFIFWYIICLYGSNSNQSKTWRVGLTLRYIPSSTFVNRKNWECVLLRGKKEKEVKNIYVERPVFKNGNHMEFDAMDDFKK